MNIRRTRRGFSLLEVVIALAILVTSMVLLAEIQTLSIEGSREVQKILVGTSLAQEKLNEVLIRLEGEGFTDKDVCEEGDFEEFGDEGVELEFGDSLKDYHFEYCISEIDIGLAGDIAGMAESLGGTGLSGQSEATSELTSEAPDLNSLGFSNEMISDMLGNYVREVRVRVWWGEDSKQAEEEGNEVVLVSHVANPTGAVVMTGAQDGEDEQ